MTTGEPLAAITWHLDATAYQVANFGRHQAVLYCTGPGTQVEWLVYTVTGLEPVARGMGDDGDDARDQAARELRVREADRLHAWLAERPGALVTVTETAAALTVPEQVAEDTMRFFAVRGLYGELTRHQGGWVYWPTRQTQEAGP